jgi:hypothetical protein
MLIDYIRQVHASKKFFIGNNFKFVEFSDTTPEGISEKEPIPEAVEIWAAIEVPFRGEIPESYKTLNLMIGDWVAKNENALTKLFHEKLIGHFKKHYPSSDTSGIIDSEETSIWLDQLDYMPRIDEKNKTMTIEIELVLDTEPIKE